jgi:filamentous hemagglutinin family protein
MNANTNRYSLAIAIHAVSCRSQALAGLLACALAGGVAFANPTGPQIVAGQVSIVGSGNQLSITNSPGAIINWQSFSISAGELTRFIQQSSSSSVLNRITGQNPSQVFGTLQSNGKVFLINPNGVLFGRGAQVNVSGLVASSLNLSDADFLTGKLDFSGSSGAGKLGDISNQGAITTPSGGQVYLIAPNVANGGIITSPAGDVMLAAGHSVNLADSTDPDMRVVISAPGNQALNVGSVVADSGRIGIYGALVNQLGLVSANSAVVGANGKIVFKSSGDTLLGAGSSTTATGAGTGGEIQVLGNRVGLTGNALVDASGQTGGGTVLIGGDTHGSNPAIQNATLTYMGPMARIMADAQQSGDGGKVVVWSDQQTQMYGEISARGGGQGGNGGFVEASSANLLDFRGLVDLRAPKGTAGNLLLDPTDITIETGTSTDDIDLPESAPFTITGSNPTSILSVADLQNELGLGNVTVSTSSSASAPLGGTITVASPVAWNNANSLTLAADQSVYITAPITATAGTLVLTAANGNITQTINVSAPAAISVAALAAIAPNGSVTLTEPSNNVSGTIAGASLQGFSFANSGGIAVGSVASTSGITSGSGTIALMAGDGDITQSTAITGSALYAAASAGSVILNNAANSLGTIAGSASGSGGFSMVNSNNLSVGPVTYNTSPTTIPNLSSGTQAGILSSGGPISLAVTGNIDVADPSVGISAGANAVTLNSSGAVTTSNGTITGSTLQVSAATGVGSLASPLNTSVGSLQVTNSTSGDISVSNTDAALTIADLGSLGYGIRQTSSGNIYIASDNAIAVNSAVQVLGATGNVGLQAASGIALNSSVAAATVGGIVALQTLNGDITEDTTLGQITAPAISAVASNGSVELNSAANAAGTIAGSANGGSGFAFLNGNSFTVGTVSAVGNIHAASGVTSQTGFGFGVFLQTPADGDITLSTPVNGGSTTVLVDAAGTVVQGTGGLITAGRLDVDAGSQTGIGSSAAPLLADVGALASINSQGPVFVNNSGNLAIDSISAIGAVNVNSGGSLTIPTAQTCDCSLSITGSSVTLTAYGSLLLNVGSTVTASGPVALYAGYDAASSTYVGSPNTLTLNGSVTGSAVNLFAGGAISVTGSVTGTLTQMPSLYSPATPPPTLAQCIATPTLPGCSSVLPTLAQCTSTPTAPGCSVVLPTLAQCTSTPTAPGCSVVLPTLAQCTSTPTAPGCSVVLPTLAQCTSTPSAPGCSVVLPTLAQCTSTPTAQGCSVVLPTLAQCEANPAVTGCGAVLPPAVSVATAAPVVNADNMLIVAVNTTVNTVDNNGSQPSNDDKTSGSQAQTGNTSTTKPGATNDTAKKMYCN